MDYRDLKGSAPGMRVEDGALVIAAVPKQAEGYYLCEANNGIGAGLSAVIYLSVQGNSFSWRKWKWMKPKNFKNVIFLHSPTSI